MIPIPIWANMLLGALLGFAGLGLVLRARPGPKQKLIYLAGGLLVVLGALLFLNFI
jgi:hypothetical protein